MSRSARTARSTHIARAAATALVLALVAGVPAAALAADGRPAAAGSAAHHADGRGTLLSAVPVALLNRTKTDAYVESQGFDVPGARYATASYRITYRTIGTDGRPTTASGLVSLPVGGPRELRTVSYEHGTRAEKKGVASTDPDTADRAVAVMFAGAGFAAVAPDYLGLGTGPGHHPYMDIGTETSASLDMLRAARTFAAGHGRTLQRQVLVTGFSQGGVASMGLGRALQGGADPYFRLQALAPVSGPFDARGAELPAAFDGRLDPAIAAYYLGYFTTSWNRLYPLYGSTSEAFLPPYDRTVEQLFDGSHNDEEILGALPGDPRKLFTPAFIDTLQHPTGAFAEALRVGDSTCSDWTPRVPVRIFATETDRDVAIANSEHCQAQLRANGVHAPLLHAGEAGHMSSPFVAYPQILSWFEELRRG
ncbi:MULTISPECIES: lipase family protein [Streptomyces]|uniref:lipase family protein n=1 Tax=Streptomyces TaxID=1883 RepID=UPI001E579CB6|nr:MULTISPECIES: lipase family protein [Streptomyces]MCZ4101339.1 lipase family protein [Streptomyces sp. H39-C1]